MRVANNADFHMFGRILARNSQNSYFHLSIENGRSRWTGFYPQMVQPNCGPLLIIETTAKSVLLSFFEEHKLRRGFLLAA
jgi:hypothetical protein